MTLAWIRYQEKYSYGVGEVLFIELDLPDDLYKARITKRNEKLIEYIGSELEERRLISNWSERWRGVDLQIVEAPPYEVLRREVEYARSRVISAANCLARYEAQFKSLPPERLPESKL